MPFAQADGVSVYYEVHGDGPAVLFAHGSGGHHAIWWQQVPHFRDRYTVLTVDLPGFGRSQSDREEYDTYEYPEAILAVLDEAELPRAVLVGQSLGAPPSLRLAVRHPERVAGVVLTNSIGGIDHEEISPMVLADRAEAVKLPVIDRLLSKRFQYDEPEKVFLFGQMGTFNAARYDQLRNQWTGQTTIEEIRAAIAQGVHVCYIGGDEDAVLKAATYARVQELIPEANVTVVPGAPHSMYWEAPDRFNAELDRLLETIYHPAMSTF